MSVGRDLLAGEIECEPVLWDFSHPDHYRKDRKNAAWDRICNRLCELGYDCVVPELKKEWKSTRDAHSRDGKRPQSGSAARPIRMRRSLFFSNTAHVSGLRMTNIADDDDDIDFIDENNPPSPALLGRKKEEWTRKPPLGPPFSKKVEDSRREGDVELRGESPIPQKRKVLAESTPTNSKSIEKVAVTQAIVAVKSRMAELSADDKFIHFGACIEHNLKSEPKEEVRAKMIAIELAVNPLNPPQDAYRESGPPTYEGGYLEERSCAAGCT